MAEQWRTESVCQDDRWLMVMEGSRVLTGSVRREVAEQIVADHNAARADRAALEATVRGFLATVWDRPLGEGRYEIDANDISALEAALAAPAERRGRGSSGSLGTVGASSWAAGQDSAQR